MDAGSPLSDADTERSSRPTPPTLLPTPFAGLPNVAPPMPGECTFGSVVAADDLSIDEPDTGGEIPVIPESRRLTGEIVDCVLACD